VKKIDQGSLSGIFGTDDKNAIQKSAELHSGEVANALVRRGVFSSPDSSWVCHGANSTTGVAVSSSVCHAFGPGIGVERFV
jgi:hypothetical protein